VYTVLVLGGPLDRSVFLRRQDKQRRGFGGGRLTNRQRGGLSINAEINGALVTDGGGKLTDDCRKLHAGVTI
jgi:hypothetical protein